jgi:hypothetical protein
MSDPKMTKERCAGCYNNFYNGQGASQCWSFETATVELRKKVPVDQMPPWNQPPALYPSCYRQSKYVFFKGDRRTW